ncbi:hypothetical protein PQQ84_22495 [Paraburkholderia strydomiana]|uniref:hypothetical protein n=1 Tax=Paraburkholderia strydomiana TaxID=1245417 RepID=UPI0038B9E46F
MNDTTMNTGAASLSDEMERAYQRRHALVVTEREDFEAGYRAAIAAGGAQEAVAFDHHEVDHGTHIELVPHYAAPLPRVAATVSLTDEQIANIAAAHTNSVVEFDRLLKFARALLASSNAEQEAGA